MTALVGYNLYAYVSYLEYDPLYATMDTTNTDYPLITSIPKAVYDTPV